jgi:hypothetical protein
MERKKVTTEIVIHHKGGGLGIAPKILRELRRVAETFDNPANSCSEVSDRLDFRSGPEQQQADRKRQRLDENATPFREKKKISRQQIGAERLAFKARADTAKVSVSKQATNISDEVAAFSGCRERFNQNL